MTAILNTTWKRFLFASGLLLVLFCAAYAALSSFLADLSRSAEQVQTAAAIHGDIRWIGTQFWKLRFWEKGVLARSNPDADKEFGVVLEQVRARLDAFDPGDLSARLADAPAGMRDLLMLYEEAFNRLIQLKTDQRLNRTQLESVYQAVSSSVLMRGEQDLLKPLLNLDRFLDRYLASRTDAEYQTLNMVFGMFRARMGESGAMDGRAADFMDRFEALVHHDADLEKEIRVIDARFDDITRDMTARIEETTRIMDDLSREAVHTGAVLRRRIQKHFIASSVVTFLLLMGVIMFIARKLIDPIRRMSDTVARVRAGEDLRFVTHEKDDIAQLGLAFNDLLDAVRGRRRELEALVEERTEKLIDTNARLRESLDRHKRTEIELLEARDAADAANRSKSAFLANMSHELRTPLNAILGFSRIMSNDKTLSAAHRENLDIIRQSGGHLLTLINHVLDLSKIEAGRMTLQETDMDLGVLIDGVERMFRPRAGRKGLTLRADVAADAPRHIRADPVRLRQVLINLLNNAIKFTEEGEVALRVRRMTAPPDAGAAGGARPCDEICLLFEVEDTGPGVDEAEKKNLFKAFVQTRAGTASSGGAGLGLYISREFVRLMGGDIRVDGAPGRGTRFSFYIREIPCAPAAAENDGTDRRVVGLAPGQPVRRILVADDHEINRKLIVRLLAPLGFDLREAEDGQEAVDAWKDWRPHLILMDIRMPNKNGYEAVQEIRRLETGDRRQETGISKDNPSEEDGPPLVSGFRSPVSIISLTAISLENEEQKALGAGCDDFLRKPFNDNELYDLLHKHLGTRFAYEPVGTVERGRAAGSAGTAVRPEAAAALPDDIRGELHAAAETANYEAAMAQILRIRSHDAALSEALAALVGGYQFDAVQKLFESKEREDA